MSNENVSFSVFSQKDGKYVTVSLEEAVKMGHTDLLYPSDGDTFRGMNAHKQEAKRKRSEKAVSLFENSGLTGWELSNHGYKFSELGLTYYPSTKKLHLYRSGEHLQMTTIQFIDWMKSGNKCPFDFLDDRQRKSRSKKNKILKFGKYKGTRMSDVPDSYLVWMANNMLCESYQKAAEDELRARAKLYLIYNQE